MSDEQQSTLGVLLSGGRIGKFASVGVVGFLADTTVLTSLRLGLGLPEVVAKAAAIETAIIVMFLANERWTFAAQGAPGRGPFFRRMGRSHVVRATGATVQFVSYWLLTQQTNIVVTSGGVDWWFLLASPIAIMIASVVNYCFESLFTWRVHRSG